MKRALLVPLIVIAFVSMSCGLFSSPKAEENSAAEPEAPSQTRPTKVAIQPEKAKPEAQEEETVVEAGPGAYQDTFDSSSSDWSEPVFVTTQASGHDPYTKISTDNGVLRFAVSDKETYVYKFYQYGIDGDVTISIDYQSKGAVNNGMAVVCKADPDLNSWYEVRFTSSNSNINYYLYDKKRKTEEGKNPYVEVGKAHLKVEELGPTKPNHLDITCSDNQITVNVNQGKKLVTQELTTSLSGSIVGLGAMSYDVVPVTIDYDTITIQPAQ